MKTWIVLYMIIQMGTGSSARKQYERRLFSMVNLDLGFFPCNQATLNLIVPIRPEPGDA